MVPLFIDRSIQVGSSKNRPLILDIGWYTSTLKRWPLNRGDHLIEVKIAVFKGERNSRLWQLTSQYRVTTKYRFYCISVILYSWINMNRRTTYRKKVVKEICRKQNGNSSIWFDQHKNFLLRNLTVLEQLLWSVS